MPSTTETTSTAIRARREALFTSRLALAAKAGVSVTHLANLEAGVGSTDTPAGRQVSAALDRLEAERQVAA